MSAVQRPSQFQVGFPNTHSDVYAMRNFRIKNIVLDSNDRNMMVFEDLHEFVLDLGESIRNVAALRLLNVKLYGTKGTAISLYPVTTAAGVGFVVSSNADGTTTSSAGDGAGTGDFIFSGLDGAFGLGNNSIYFNGFPYNTTAIKSLAEGGSWNSTVNETLFMTLNDYPLYTCSTQDGNARSYFTWINQWEERLPAVTGNIYHDPYAYVFAPAEPRLSRFTLRLFNYDHTPFRVSQCRIVVVLAAYCHMDTMPSLTRTPVYAAPTQEQAPKHHSHHRDHTDKRQSRSAMLPRQSHLYV